MSERVLFNCCDDVDGVGDKAAGTYGPEAPYPVVGLYAWVGDAYRLCREGAADVDGVNNPCARPWLKSLIAEPGMIGAGPRPPGPKLFVAPMPENDEDADNGREVGVGWVGWVWFDIDGKEFPVEVVGTKSNRGDSRGATP